MNKNGFSLAEVLIAIVLVGLAVASLVAANSVFTQNNSVALETSTAEYLLEQMRELTMLLPVLDPNTKEFFISKEETFSAYDNVGDFDDSIFNPPISADRESLAAFSSFSQKVTVQKVSASNFEQPVSDTDSSPFIRIEVDIYHRGNVLLSSSWIRAQYYTNK